jgi:serine phosphatase RsbU (regulator of sigma subunit)
MIKNVVNVLLTTAAIFVVCFSQAQNIQTTGRLATRHFPVKEYGSAGQIWCGTQNASGDYIFGNRQDILSYNGSDWTKLGVDKEKTSAENQKTVASSFVASFFESSDKTIFVGRENNFGYLDYSSKGQYCYFPLLVKPETTGFGKVWNIFEINNGEVLFIGEKGLFTYKNKVVRNFVIPRELKGFSCRTSCKLGKGLLLEYQNKDDADNREYKYLYIDALTGKAKVILNKESKVLLKNIRGSFEINKQWYILDVSLRLLKVTENGGTCSWIESTGDYFSLLKNYQPNIIKRVGDYIYYGTEDGGLIITDLNGNLVRSFDFTDKLENIYVNDFFVDKDRNIWLCLDNGIQFIESSSPISYLKKDEGVTSQIEAIDFYNGLPMLGLSTDIYLYKDVNNHGRLFQDKTLQQRIFDIESVSTSRGLKTLVIANNGIYEYNPVNGTKKALVEVYAYAFCKDPINRDRVYFSNEAGLGSLTMQKDGSWKYEELVPDAGGETISAAYCGGKLYLSVRNKGVGVYDPATKKYRLIKIPSAKNEDNQYYVQSFKNKLYVGTADGILYLDKKTNKLIPFEHNIEFFGAGHLNTIHRIININNKQLWVVVYKEYSDDDFEFETGWMEIVNGEWKYTKWPLATLKESGVTYAIQKGNNNTVWIGSSEGLFIFNMDAVRKRASNIKVFIDKIEIDGKPIVYNVGHAKPIPELEYAKNSFRITFHSNFFSTQEPNMYRYKLDGYNDRWSEWSELNFANFEKIGEGTYTLLVQSKNFYGQESDILRYEITVLPPWYRSVWAYILYFIALIFFVFGVVRLSLMRVRRQNIKLEETVQERTKEIAEQNNLLEHQKAEITQKSNDILDSIHYAKRIQNTILPADSRLRELFDEHFVFYRPKDIVSGDFYWAREVQDKVIFSAVDCTGHGVPGALVSIVGNNGLLRAVNEFKLTEPKDILDKLREIVVSAFRAEGTSDVKDGMDIALCSIDYKTGELKFAGANNECVIIRNGEIIELKPDKQPIGQFIDAKPFTQKTFQLEPNDCIYLYTDGYVDQFGGERLKKYKSKPFKAMLSRIGEMNMTEQYVKVQNEFDTWKAYTEQVDDVCVVAVKFKGVRS